MNLTDFDKLKKVMALTNSDVDGEALSAIRMANSLLTKHKKTWDDIFAAKVKVDLPVQFVEPKVVNSDPELARAFAKLEKTVKKGSGFYQFVQKMHEEWVEYGSLSYNQRATIIRCSKKDYMEDDL